MLLLGCGPRCCHWRSRWLPAAAASLDPPDPDLETLRDWALPRVWKEQPGPVTVAAAVLLRVRGLNDVDQPWLVCRVLVRHEMSFCAGGASRFSAGGRIGLYALCALPCMFVRVRGGHWARRGKRVRMGRSTHVEHIRSTFGARWSTILRIW
jgi:hypothetical protein